jgi:hypothetical protein
MRFNVALAAASTLLGAACASSTKTEAAPGIRPAAPATRTNTNILSAAELEGTTFDNVATAVIILRPQWAKYDVGRVSTGEPTLVYDERRLIGSFERLKDYQVKDVKELRWLSRDEARVRYGPNAQAGIMFVKK